MAAINKLLLFKKKILLLMLLTSALNRNRIRKKNGYVKFFKTVRLKGNSTYWLET